MHHSLPFFFFKKKVIEELQKIFIGKSDEILHTYRRCIAVNK